MNATRYSLIPSPNGYLLFDRCTQQPRGIAFEDIVTARAAVRRLNFPPELLRRTRVSHIYSVAIQDAIAMQDAGVPHPVITVEYFDSPVGLVCTARHNMDDVDDTETPVEILL